MSFVVGGKRPVLPTRKDTGCPDGYARVIEECWRQLPVERMNASAALDELERIFDRINGPLTREIELTELSFLNNFDV